MSKFTLASDAIGRFLAPLEETFALRESLRAVGSLDQAAIDATSRLDQASRDIDTAKAQLDAVNQGISAATGRAEGIIAQANIDATAITDAAKDAAAKVTAKRKAAEDAATAAAAATLADLAAQIELQTDLLDVLTQETTDAKAKADSASAELATIRTRLGG